MTDDDQPLGFRPNGKRALRLVEAVIENTDDLGPTINGELWDVELPAGIDEETVRGRQVAGIQVALDVLTFTKSFVDYVSDELFHKPVAEVWPLLREGIEQAIEHTQLDEETLADLDRYLDKSLDDDSGPAT